MLLSLYGQIHVVSLPGLRRGLVVVDDRLSAPMLVQPLVFVLPLMYFQMTCFITYSNHSLWIAFAAILLSELVCNEVNVLCYFT